MNKEQRKAIESKIIQAIQEVIKSSDVKTASKLEKVVKAGAKMIAKKIAKESERMDATRGVKTVSVLKKSVIRKTAAAKKKTASKKRRKVSAKK